MHTFVDPSLPEYDGDEPPRPAAPEALRLAEAMVELDRAAEALEKAKRNVPNYTGQYSSEFFYRHEEDAYNRAAEAFADAVVAGVNKAGKVDD